MQKDDPDCFIHGVLDSNKLAKDDERELPFYLSEYKDGLQGGPGVAFGGPHADTAYNSAFIIRNVPLLNEIEISSYWTFTDIFEEGWLGGIPFYGGYGLQTSQGVKKPAYRAFELLNHAGDFQFDVKVSDSDKDYDYEGFDSTVSAFVTSKDQKGMEDVQFFFSNFGPMKDTIDDDNIWDPKTRTVKLNKLGDNLTKGNIARIDDDVTNAYDMWVTEFESPQYLSDEQLKKLNDASEVEVEKFEVDADGSFTFDIPAYGVVALQFE